MKNANPVSSLLRALLLSGAVLATAGCGRSDPASASGASGATTSANTANTSAATSGTKGATAVADAASALPASEFFTINVGDKPVKMQLAVRNHEMERGLMERRDLKPDEGMIFIYESGKRMSFWMRNTPTALDIGFFTADGILSEAVPMYPFDETPVASRSDAIQFALEMNQGWFIARDVKPGAKIDLKALAAALRARGFEPSAYGLK